MVRISLIGLLSIVLAVASTSLAHAGAWASATAQGASASAAASTGTQTSVSTSGSSAYAEASAGNQTEVSHSESMPPSAPSVSPKPVRTTVNLPQPTTVATTQPADESGATPAPEVAAIAQAIQDDPAPAVPSATTTNDQATPARLANLLLGVLYVLALNTILLLIVIYLAFRASRAATYQRF